MLRAQGTVYRRPVDGQASGHRSIGSAALERLFGRSRLHQSHRSVSAPVLLEAGLRRAVPGAQRQGVHGPELLAG